MNRDLRSQLKSLSALPTLAPRAEWKSRVSARLMNEVPGAPRREASPSRAKNFSNFLSFLLPRPIATIARASFVYVLIFGVAIYGWGVSVSAAESSLPGDFLYSVKKVNEKKELLLAGSNGEKVVVLLNHAQKRAGELKKIQTSPSDVVKKQEQAKTVVLSLKENIKSTNEEIQKVKTSSGDPSALLSVVSEKTSQIATDLSNSVTNIPTEIKSTDLSMAVKTEVAVVANLVAETNVNAVVTAAHIIANGPTPSEGSSQAVNLTLEKALVSLESTFNALQSVASSTATGTLPVVEASTPSSASSTVSSTAGASTETSTIPMAVVTTSSTATGTIPTVVAPERTVQEKVETAAQAVADAKVLLGQENLRGALEKLQTALNLKKEIETSVTPEITLKVYSTSLPQPVPPASTATGTVSTAPAPTGSAATSSSTQASPSPQPVVR